MLVVDGGELAFDEKIAHLSGDLEGITVGDDDVGDFAALKRTNLISETKNLGGIESDGFQRFVVGKAVGDGICGLLAEAPRKGIIEAAEGEFYAGGRELRRLREQAVVRIIFFAGQLQCGTKNDGNAFRTQKVLYFVSFGAAAKDHFQFRFL